MGTYFSDESGEDEVENVIDDPNGPFFLKEERPNLTLVDDIDVGRGDPNFGMLPILCLHQIFLFLPNEDLRSVMVSCKLFRDVSNTNLFWREKFMRIVEMNKEAFEIYKKRECIFDLTRQNFKELYYDFVYSFYMVRDQYFRDRIRDSEGHSVKNNLSVKFLVCGGKGVGKTSFIQRFSNDEFSENPFPPFVPNFRLKRVTFKNKDLVVQLWDSSGGKRYRQYNVHFYRKIHGCMICFSLTDMKSFEDVTEFYELTTRNGYKGIKESIVFCGMKNDLEKERVVSYSMIERLIKGRFGMSMKNYCQVSSKTGDFVYYPVGRMLERIDFGID